MLEYIMPRKFQVTGSSCAKPESRALSALQFVQAANTNQLEQEYRVPCKSDYSKMVRFKGNEKETEETKKKRQEKEKKKKCQTRSLHPLQHLVP